MRCETCRWWDSLTDVVGLCRRHAPRRDREWPEVHDSDWCGEWEPCPLTDSPVDEDMPG